MIHWSVSCKILLCSILLCLKLSRHYGLSLPYSAKLRATWTPTNGPWGGHFVLEKWIALWPVLVVFGRTLYSSSPRQYLTYMYHGVHATRTCLKNSYAKSSINIWTFEKAIHFFEWRSQFMYHIKYYWSTYMVHNGTEKYIYNKHNCRSHDFIMQYLGLPTVFALARFLSGRHKSWGSCSPHRGKQSCYILMWKPLVNILFTLSQKTKRRERSIAE